MSEFSEVICLGPKYKNGCVVFLLPIDILAKGCLVTPHILSAADADNPSILPECKRMIEHLMSLQFDGKPALKELILFDSSFTLWMVADIWPQIKEDVLRIIDQDLFDGQNREMFFPKQ
jgi:hypothetical protein